MIECPSCKSSVPKKYSFCGNCGELVHVDPGFQRRVLQVTTQDRKQGRARKLGTAGLLLAVLSFFGYQTVDHFAATAIEKARPVIEAAVEARLKDRMKTDVETTVSRIQERDNLILQRQIQADQNVHEKRMQALEAAYDQQSKADEERFRSRLASAQPTFSPFSAGLLNFGGQWAATDLPNLTPGGYIFDPAQPINFPLTVSPLIGNEGRLKISPICFGSLAGSSFLTVSASLYATDCSSDLRSDAEPTPSK